MNITALQLAGRDSLALFETTLDGPWIKSQQNRSIYLLDSLSLFSFPVMMKGRGVRSPKFVLSNVKKLGVGYKCIWA